MKASELSAVKKIITERFRLLNQQVDARAQELVAAEKVRIRDEYKTAEKAYKTRIKKLNAAYDKLADEYKKILDEANEAGFDTRGYYREHPFEESLTPKALRDFEYHYTGSRNNPVHVSVAKAKAALKEQELTLMEELLVSGIESEDAKTFLSKIPTVEQLMAGGLTQKKALSA